MSIGGDMVGEVIAQLQPIHQHHTSPKVIIREYGGELDDLEKDTFRLPTTLFTYTEGEAEKVLSTILVEFNGAEHTVQDGSNVAYLTTYRVNVWIVAGYGYSTGHLEGGAALKLEEAYALYDAVLDLTAARRILKDAETVRLVGGERVYFGAVDGDPPAFNDGDLCAVVYKLEFTINANSVWQEFPGTAPIRAPE